MRIWSELRGLFQTKRSVFVWITPTNGFFLEAGRHVLLIQLNGTETGTELKLLLENGVVATWKQSGITPSVVVTTSFTRCFEPRQE